MDPITLILAALAAGASESLKDTAGEAIKDAYAGLKALVRRRLKGDSAAEAELDGVERQSDADVSVLKQRLEATAADRDDELLNLAREILARVDPQGSQAGKYNVAISGGKGNVVGDNATVHQTFGD